MATTRKAKSKSKAKGKAKRKKTRVATRGGTVRKAKTIPKKIAKQGTNSGSITEEGHIDWSGRSRAGADA
jgi:hypothetical protein